MNPKVPQEVIDAFTSYTPGLPYFEAGTTTVAAIGDGLINNTYKVTCELQSNFLLQKINTEVFKHPKKVQHNCTYLSTYAEMEFTNIRIPYIKEFAKEQSLYQDSNGDYWRAFEFIEDGYSIPIAENPQQARATAITFAKFSAAFDDMNVEQLFETIPNFHNLNYRYQQFDEALQSKLLERKAKAQPLTEDLINRNRYKKLYDEIASYAAFPKRVVHHDAKISNVLFSKKTGKVICPVDLDTTMPGYFISDPGDLIRSMACSADENCIDFKNLHIRKDYYQAITEGYFSVMEKSFTTAEKKYFHCSGLLIIYMQALRFITDYLKGDIYYKTKYTEHNFDRALNQFTLLKSLETFLKKEYNFSC